MTGHTKEPFTEPKAPLRHSAEPWTTEAFNDIDYGDVDYSAMILAGDGESIIAQQMSDHDADRASDCVNALAGIPDPAAYVAAFDGLVGALVTISDIEPDPDNMQRFHDIAEHALTAARLARGGE